MRQRPMTRVKYPSRRSGRLRDTLCCPGGRAHIRVVGCVEEYERGCEGGSSVERCCRWPGRVGGVGDGLLTLVLCGDVMTGRGVDQVLPHPGDPELRERYAG